MDSSGSVAVSGDVFGDGAEVSAGVGAAGDEVRLAGVLVKEFARVADDPLEVSAGGFGEGVVPAQGREIVLGSRLIGEMEEGLLGGALSLGVGSCNRESTDEGQSEQKEARSRRLILDWHAGG
jgi:hypothetical protein